MQKNEIDIKYGMDAKTVNNKIKEILGENGVNNYIEARKYLDDKDVNEVLRDIREGSVEGQSQDESKIQEERAESPPQEDAKDENHSEEEPQVQEEKVESGTREMTESTFTESSPKLGKQVTKDYEGIDQPRQKQLDFRGIDERSSTVKKDYGFIDNFGTRHGNNVNSGIRRDFERIDKPKERKKKDYEGLGESYTESTSE